MLKQVSAKEFLEQFDADVHAKIVAAIKMASASAVVMFETAELGARNFKRTAVVVGEMCTYKTVAECDGKRIGDLPSERQYAVAWCEAYPLAELAALTPPVAAPEIEVQLTTPEYTVAQGKDMAAVARKIHDWLRNTDGIDDIVPCIISIGKQSWPACSYRTEYKYTSDMTCVQDGRHKAGESYYNRRFFVAGKLPKSYKNNKVCYRRNDQDWYVSGYYQEPNPQFDALHPFAPEFGLHLWDVEEPIDHYAKKPYTRIQLVVDAIAMEEPAHA